MTSNTIIEQLNSYEFHDMIIESINFSHEKEIQLHLLALKFNDETDEYEKLRITFSEIIEMKTNELMLNRDSEFELTSFEYNYDQHFNCKLIFLLGFGKPSLTIDLKCQKIELLK